MCVCVCVCLSVSVSVCVCMSICVYVSIWFLHHKITLFMLWQLYYQVLNFGMIVSSALMIWKGLMVLTGSESPIVVVLR